MTTLEIVAFVMPVLAAGFAAGLGFFLVWLDERAEDRRSAREAMRISAE
jgi:hypothetical protein